jgi:hypothetical protein
MDLRNVDMGKGLLGVTAEHFKVRQRFGEGLAVSGMYTSEHVD